MKLPGRLQKIFANGKLERRRLAQILGVGVGAGSGAMAFLANSADHQPVCISCYLGSGASAEMVAFGVSFCSLYTLEVLLPTSLRADIAAHLRKKCLGVLRRLPCLPSGHVAPRECPPSVLEAQADVGSTAGGKAEEGALLVAAGGLGFADKREPSDLAAAVQGLRLRRKRRLNTPPAAVQPGTGQMRSRSVRGLRGAQKAKFQRLWRRGRAILEKRLLRRGRVLQLRRATLQKHRKGMILKETGKLRAALEQAMSSEAHARAGEANARAGEAHAVRCRLKAEEEWEALRGRH